MTKTQYFELAYILLPMKFIKSFFFLIIFHTLIIPTYAQAPDFIWVNWAGGSEDDNGHLISTDQSGNNYTIGVFFNNITFGSSTLTTTNFSAYFFVKHNSAGNVIWAKKIDDSNIWHIEELATDATGNSYIVGTFFNTVTIENHTITSNGARDFFIIKINPAGDILWAKSGGGASDDDEAHNIMVDANNNLLVTGIFTQPIQIGATSLPSNYPVNTFLAKFNSDGNLIWVETAGGNSISGKVSLNIENNGNYLVAASYSGTCYYDAISFSPNLGGSIIVSAKYNATGSFIWAKKVITSNTNNSNFSLVGIDTDDYGNIYFAGGFNDSINFSSSANFFVPFNQRPKIFILKLNETGNFIWAKMTGGENNFASGGLRDLIVNTNGNIYLLGCLNGSISFDTLQNSSQTSQIFIAKYDSYGDINWVKYSQGNGIHIAWAITMDPSENIYITGCFKENITLDNIPISGGNNYDMYLAKLSNNPLSLPSSPTTTLSTYPNPFSTSFQISLTRTGPATATLTDMLGRQVHRQAISVESGRESATVTPPANLPFGMYVLQVKEEGEKLRQVRVVKQ